VRWIDICDIGKILALMCLDQDEERASPGWLFQGRVVGDVCTFRAFIL
jgi:hypothetical protein